MLMLIESTDDTVRSVIVETVGPLFELGVTNFFFLNGYQVFALMWLKNETPETTEM